MTGYSFGDVLLVPFPFTDQSGSKQRPAVVVSSARYQRERPDLILMPITSQVPATPRFGEVPVSDSRAAGLLMPGIVKPVIFTMEARLVRKTLGRLADDDQRALRHCIAQMLG
ncbi:MAG TPA: type II toxin-antitoxin system PemK/MazF family toxin [Xanthomonadaceae bacterium]|nr:type II toxin-antitoxin system PemK/MazF family toxin [Xanthomonadaceae bacterium]